MLSFIAPGLYGYIGTLGTGDGLACFDLGKTIIFKSDNNWYFLPHRISTLINYKDNGYTIVIFTNTKYNSLPHINNTITTLLTYNINPWVFASTEDNIYRKPNVGMRNIFLHYYKEYINQEISFFTGDKYTDHQFANNIGLIFYNPDDIFI